MTSRYPDDAQSARRFRIAWLFLLGSAALGFGLRAETVWSWSPFAYAHLLHTHSHAAFLGWVFNAFFIAAIGHFVPAAERRSYDWLWWTMQIAVIGIVVTFPFQGYGPASITFSTVHMIAAGVFAVKLARRNVAAPVARPHLLGALGFMLLSSLGPLALGPLAAADWRDSPAYTLAIYFYLHCQATGWFPFFLQALLVQRAHEQGLPVPERAARRAAWWLFAGNLLSFSLAVLWLDPPGWVRGLALLGGALQLVGVVEFIRATAALRLPTGWPARLLARTAVAAWLLKSGLHFVGAWPVFAALLPQRPVAIGFLHLIFLGVVIPALWLWALDRGWVRADRTFRVGCLLFFAGFVGTEGMLIAPALIGVAGWPASWSLPHLLLASAGPLIAGFLLMGRFRPRRTTAILRVPGP